MISDHFPNLLLGLLLKNVVQTLVYQVLVVEPVAPILVVGASYHFIHLRLVHLLLLLIKCFKIFNRLNINIVLVSVNPVASPNFELFLNYVLAFKVKQTVGLPCPCHCLGCQDGHLGCVSGL